MMKNPNELTLNQTIILENECNHIYLEIQDLVTDMQENGYTDKKKAFLNTLCNKFDELKTVCRLLGYDVVDNKTTGLYSLCARLGMSH